MNRTSSKPEKKASPDAATPPLTTLEAALRDAATNGDALNASEHGWSKLETSALPLVASAAPPQDKPTLCACGGSFEQSGTQHLPQDYPKPTAQRCARCGKFQGAELDEDDIETLFDAIGHLSLDAPQRKTLADKVSRLAAQHEPHSPAPPREDDVLLSAARELWAVVERTHEPTRWFPALATLKAAIDAEPAAAPPALAAPPQPLVVRHRSGCAAWGGDYPQTWRSGDEAMCNCGAKEHVSALAAPPPRDALSAPMAAALLITLKEECEAQHARAEKAEAEVRLFSALIEQYRGIWNDDFIDDFGHSKLDDFLTELEAALARLAAPSSQEPT